MNETATADVVDSTSAADAADAAADEAFLRNASQKDSEVDYEEDTEEGDDPSLPLPVPVPPKKAAADAAEQVVYFFGAASPLSNFHSALFRLDDQVFTNVQQAFLSRKAKKFLDSKAYDAICRETNPFELRKLSVGIANFNRKHWLDECEDHMYEAYVAKFRQNPKYMAILLATQDARLANCALRDNVWGIGCDKGTRRALWKGENRLGVILAQVRADLARETNTVFAKDAPVPLQAIREAEGCGGGNGHGSSSTSIQSRKRALHKR